MEEQLNYVPGSEVPMSFRVSSEEKVRIIQNARNKNISVSAYLRLAALGEFSQPLLKDQSLLEYPNAAVKTKTTVSDLLIPCTPKQRELLEVIYHPAVFADADFLPEEYSELSFEKNLLIALFTLQSLKRLRLPSTSEPLSEGFIINDGYDVFKFYPSLQLEHNEFSDLILKTVSIVMEAEETRTSEVIARHQDIENAVVIAFKLANEAAELLKKK